jgi:hypothetical protein
LTTNESLDITQTNSINTLFSTYANSTTVAAISAGLNSRISSLTAPLSSTYVNDFDARYVNVSGDSMFGSLSLSYTGQIDGLLSVTELVTGSNGNGTYRGIISNVIANPQGNTNRNYVGSYNIVNVASSDTSDYTSSYLTLIGSTSNILHDGSGTIQMAAGSVGYVENSNTGTIVNAISLFGKAPIDSNNSPAQIVNAYTCYLEEPIQDGNNVWSLYSEGLAQFAKNVIVGTTLTVGSISGSNGNIVTHDSAGTLLDSGILATSLATNSTIASISGNLQSQINGKANTVHNHTSLDITDFSEAVDDRVSNLLVAGSNISLSYNDVANTLTINSTAPSISAGLLNGSVDCDIYSSLYTISHPSVDANYSYPTISLLTPVSGSNLFVQGISNRQSNSFQVTLSEVPNVTGYKILWHLPTTASSIIGTSIVNQQMTTLPSVTKDTSGSYTIGFTDTVVYSNSLTLIYLPVVPSTNEHHWIVNTDSGDVTILGNGKNIWALGVNNPDITLPANSSLHFHYNAIKDKWYII